VTTDAPRLALVYNAEAGVLAGAVDTVHKIVSPGTYPCSLCAVTYGLLAMRGRWRDWLATVPLPVVFHHRRDFHAAFPQAADWRLPLVAMARGDDLEVLVPAETLAGLDLDGLIATLELQLTQRGWPASAP
jgi:hypothetical protein